MPSDLHSTQLPHHPNPSRRSRASAKTHGSSSKKEKQQYGKLEEFKKLNPNGKVPAILDHGFNLYESHTILRYLATSRDCPDHWYPTDFKKRAKINEYLDWHHNNIRLGAGGYFFRKYVSGLTGKPAPASLIQESYDMIEKSCSTIEKMFFYHDKTYMFGD